MNGFLMLTACIDNRAFFTEVVSMAAFERLANDLCTSSLGSHSRRAHMQTQCHCKGQNGVLCRWNASYTPTDCRHLEQENIDANTLEMPNAEYIDFCDVELGCWRRERG